ncbi:MAG TPA: PAS domain S-box protein [Burkholderiaceae bacterium]|nr:PAS domain S-box protein [Burkholderiaceae bacterium]
MNEPTRDKPTQPLGRDEERFRLLVNSVRHYAISMLDPQGRILTWNAGAERIQGYQAHKIIGSHFSRLYPPDALARGLPERGLAMAKREGAFEDEGWSVRGDGSAFWANVVITALRKSSGELIGFANVTRDLTQRRHHEEALRQSEERFRLLIEGVREYAIFMLDVNGKVVSWNVGAQRIKGYVPDEIIGRHFSIFYPPEAIESGWPEHELQVASDKGSFVDTGWRVRKDGTTFWANVTITALRDNHGQLIGFAKLTRDLNEAKRIEAMEHSGRQRDELLEAERSARMAAQRATRVKDEFLATLSHELRTPLSSILGWTQVLLKRPRTVENTDELHRAIEVIDRNARAQVQLIDDLLDLSRIMSGKIRLDLQQTSLQQVVHDAIESAMPAASAKDIRMQSVLDPTPARVSGDRGRLQQVVWNLLTNAIKFTPKGGQVQVLLQRIESHIELSVSDTGIGIPTSFLPCVFDRFSQRDGSTTRVHGGLGLGLAICKQLVELHGGSIRASSPGEGKGATFFVELPVSIVQVEEQRARIHPTAEIHATEAVSLPSLEGVHAFVVDDEPDARDLLRRMLEDQEARVTTFASGEEALEALKTSRPSLIVSDIGMPHMDGYQMIRTLRATEAPHARIPALALTAFARAEDRKRSLAAGYQSHLSKPFDVAELILLVASLIGR